LTAGEKVTSLEWIGAVSTEPSFLGYEIKQVEKAKHFRLDCRGRA
jgi:hypothetical protein